MTVNKPSWLDCISSKVEECKDEFMNELQRAKESKRKFFESTGSETIELTLFDNEKNREKSTMLSPFELLIDDADNPRMSDIMDNFFYGDVQDDDWNKKFRITIEII